MSFRALVSALGVACTVALVGVGCSSSSTGTPAGDASSEASTNDAGGDATATCASPGKVTAGPADTHCAASDAGPATVQPTSAASCHPDTGGDDAGGDSGCPFGDTMYGQSGDDDDCKYHVQWSSSPLCEGSAGVAITVVATNKTDGSPLIGANTSVETFTTTPGDASCDNASTHPGPNSGVVLTEGPPGTYTGHVQFDAAGAWTLRFHFHEECADVLPDSPHGHAAFHLTLP
jgi:hypothetical protein